MKCEKRVGDRECGGEVTVLNVTNILVGYCLSGDHVVMTCPCGGKLARPYNDDSILKCVSCRHEVLLREMHYYQLELFASQEG